MNNKDKKNRRILIIDDNEAIHGDFRAVLGGINSNAVNVTQEEAVIFGVESNSPKGLDFEIDSVFQGKEGLEKIQQALKEGRPYAMAFVDVRMPPGWDGIETIQRIWAEYPQLQVCICTAYSDYSWHDLITQLGQTDKLLILKKPFDNVEVRQIAISLVEKWHLNQIAQLKQEQLEERVKERTAELEAANDLLEKDIAKRKKVEEELEQSQKELIEVAHKAGMAEAANAAKSDFLANMSHELRTPLHIILSFAGFGIKEHAAAKPEKLLDYFQRIRQSADSLLTLLSDLLDLAKLELNKMAFNFQPTLVSELICSVAHEFESLALEQDLTIQCDTSDFDEHITLDVEKTKQVLRNLLSNAIKLSPKQAEIKIDLNRTDTSIVISVSDQGPGIPADELEVIFDKFVQSSKTKSGTGGTGLGLAICSEIVEAHKGRIWAQNNPDGGAVFSFEIPIDSEDDTNPELLLEDALAASKVQN